MIADVASYVVPKVGCRKPTFYRYLSDMEREGAIGKEYRVGRLYCYLKEEP